MEECVTMGATEELFKKYGIRLPTWVDREKPDISQDRRETLQKLSESE